MNQTPGSLRATVRGARWGLPWLCALAISTSFAYAITVGMAHPPFTSNASTTVAAVHASSEVCDTTGGRMFYVGLNSWVHAETGAARCPEGMP